MNKQTKRAEKDRGRVVWILLAAILICLPVAAIGKLIVASDDELDDVVAQSLLTFETVHRDVTVYTVSSEYGSYGVSLQYDAAILKLNGTIKIENVAMNAIKMGGSAGSGVFDIDIDGEDGGHNNMGIVWGGSESGGGTYPVYMRGIRIELAYDDIGSANPNFKFLRIGADNFSGLLVYNQTGQASWTDRGCIDRISMDGHLDTNQGLAPSLDVNVRRATETDSGVLGVMVDNNNVLRQYYNCGPVAGQRTDWFISFSNVMTAWGGTNDTDGYHQRTDTNEVAFNPQQAVHSNVPGYGWWMHFQTTYVNAVLW